MRLGTYELAANVSLLFTEHDYADRFAAARAAGFTAVETWWPFPTADPDRAEVDALLGALDRADVRLVGLNFFGGDMAGGERGVLSHPHRRGEFRASLEVIRTVAERTGCAVFNALYGQRLVGVDAELQDRCARENLVEAISALPETATVVLEPLTVGENGTYPLTTGDSVAAVIDEVRAWTTRSNLGLLFDTYHLTNNGEDLLACVDNHVERIRHVQLADSPGRGEPGTGTIDFRAVLTALAERGYSGVVAAEYRPRAGTEAGLGWITALTGS